MVDTLAPPGGLAGKKPHMSGGGIYFKRCVDYGATVIKMLEVRIDSNFDIKVGIN